MKLAFAVLTVAAAAAGIRTGPVQDRAFLLHVDATATANTLCWKWETPVASTCGFRGTAAPDGRSQTFQRAVSVVWCAPASDACDIAKGRTMPPGYVRWMKFCLPVGSEMCGKTDWILGAVQMPNGPFHVVDGRVGGVQVQADDGNQRRISQPNGPLALIVTHIRSINAASDAFSYGLTGRIRY